MFSAPNFGFYKRFSSSINWDSGNTVGVYFYHSIDPSTHITWPKHSYHLTQTLISPDPNTHITWPKHSYRLTQTLISPDSNTHITWPKHSYGYPSSAFIQKRIREEWEATQKQEKKEQEAKMAAEEERRQKQVRGHRARWCHSIHCRAHHAGSGNGWRSMIYILPVRVKICDGTARV